MLSSDGALSEQFYSLSSLRRPPVTFISKLLTAATPTLDFANRASILAKLGRVEIV